jgi:hypothetical protein
MGRIVVSATSPEQTLPRELDRPVGRSVASWARGSLGTSSTEE